MRLLGVDAKCQHLICSTEKSKISVISKLHIWTTHHALGLSTEAEVVRLSARDRASPVSLILRTREPQSAAFSFCPSQFSSHLSTHTMPSQWRALTFSISQMLRKLSKPTVRAAAAVVLTLLVLLLVVCQLRFRFPGDAICETEEAAKYSWLCGTTTRVCVDRVTEPAPRSLVVVAAGATRAASTWLYNALRILMRIRDPNTVTGWYRDLELLYGSYGRDMGRGNGTRETANRVDAFRSLGSVLIKLHLVMDWHEFNGGGDADTAMAPHVDAVFTSHRDLRTAVRSVRDMGWGVLTPKARLSHPDFCRKRDTKEVVQFLRKGQYDKESVWVNLAQASIQCRNALIESAGDKLKMDLKSEDIANMGRSQTLATLRQMGAHLDYGYSETELEMAAHELSRLTAPRCDGGFDYEMDVNPVTHLHKGHIRMDKSAGAQAADRRGMAAIGADDICSRWLRHHGYEE